MQAQPLVMQFHQWWTRAACYAPKKLPQWRWPAVPQGYDGTVLGRHCPHSPTFTSQNRWKLEGTESSLYWECGRTAQPRLAVFSMAFKLLWGLVQEKGLILKFSLVGAVMQQSELMVCPGSRNPAGRSLPHPSRQSTSLYELKAEPWTFSSRGNSHVTTPQTVVLTMARSRNFSL